jgi:hypothetical protein
MADVFISYAKTDRPLALKLAAMLEAEGWKVWWDTSLAIGDDFRNEIMTELGRARAVIVIWTDTSVKSDWVRSEAGRAQADRKLIPVKLEHLTYKDLPPPFDVLHTENVSEDDKIRAAVIAQLAKPAVEPSATALLMKGFQWELLTWFGIIGGAAALFSSLSFTLALAPLARRLVDHWKEWTHAFWQQAFGWLGIHLAPEWTPVLSFLLFWSLLTIGQVIKVKSTIKNQQGADIEPLPFSWRQALYFSLYLIGMIWLSWRFPEFFEGVSIVGRGWTVAFIWSFFPLLAGCFFMARAGKVHAAVSICLMTVFGIIITLNHLMAMKPSEGLKPTEGIIITLIAMTMISILPQILLSVASAKAVSRRLIFLAIGSVILIALNELSKLVREVCEHINLTLLQGTIGNFCKIW